MELGAAIRHEFMLQKGSCFLNNGSYGAVPKRVRNYKLSLQEEMEEHPEKFFSQKGPVLHDMAVKAAAYLLHADRDDTFIVQNTTKGCNTVLKSFPFRSGDGILITSESYTSIVTTAAQAALMTGDVEVVKVEFTFPIRSEDDVVEMYEAKLKEHPNIKLAVIDHITSRTALLMPVRRLTALCHDHGVVVLIDGAHAPGQLPLNIPEIDADFYAGNFHKWGFSPRGCAVLWRNRNRKHAWFTPLVTSIYHGQDMWKDFSYEGINDYTTYYSLTEVKNFIQSVGGMTSITTYNTDLMDKALQLLQRSWGTSPLEIPASMRAPFMRLLRLPTLKGYEKSEESVRKLRSYLIIYHDVDAMVAYRQGELYFRLSVQIYNTIDDFRKMDSVIKSLMVAEDDIN